MHTLFARMIDWHGLDLPELASVNPWALALALGAAAGVFWLRAGLLRVLAASAAAGVVLYLAGVTL
jgi:chromate transporter